MPTLWKQELFYSKSHFSLYVKAMQRLKGPHRSAEQSEVEGEDAAEEEQKREGPLTVIYISDDLTKLQANLAYRARVAKCENKISDTWISYCKVLIKDNRSGIYHVQSLD